MPKPKSKIKPRAYSKQSIEAASLLGHRIKLARKQRKLSEKGLAERAGISRATLQKIEKGDMSCVLGLVFEVATIAGVPLFDLDQSRLSSHLENTIDKLALLPKKIRKSPLELDDDF